MKKLTIGILAHVDAGKTTLSEALLYVTGQLRKLGRVDHRDSFLDNNDLERARGITIFSKQARLSWLDTEAVLLDTPGHMDFSAEAERALQVLDCAILVISGTDGVQAHTETLWNLLRRYNIPTVLYINKMDLPGPGKVGLMADCKKHLSEGCIDFSRPMGELYEEAALCDEEALEHFLEEGEIPRDVLRSMVAGRKLFPCFFGSALKLEGVEELLEGIDTLVPAPLYGSAFGARVYKIARDAQGNRMTYLKVTGGSLQVREMLNYTAGGEARSEKIKELRLYSGAKFTQADHAQSGEICTVLGLTATFPGQGLGMEEGTTEAVLEPVMTYRLRLPADRDPAQLLPKFQELAEEDPQLHIVWDPRLKEIHARLMGQVQIEILKSLVKDRFGLDIDFDAGHILYKETIDSPVEGVGHFEPLRHYAEAHFLLEPLPRGSGLVFKSKCSEDALDRNWQRLILTHLAEKQHLGVLTGSPITDMRITLTAGRAHLKHTEGGDFRQATYRGVRQGLMQAKSILLEPCYAFTLTVPAASLGRAISDIRSLAGDFQQESDGETAVLTGIAPVAALRDYAAQVVAYTRGRGRLSLRPGGYAPCKDQDAIVAAYDYDPEADLENTPDSVFCAHGAGFPVKWDEVPNYMHLESTLRQRPEMAAAPITQRTMNLDDRELERIMDREFGPIRRPQYQMPKATASAHTIPPMQAPNRKEYLIVDGYNMLFAWDELKDIARSDLEKAREVLMDKLVGYAAFKRREVVLVFDGYKVKGGRGERFLHHNVFVVYTKENETGDMYIEALVRSIGRNDRVWVATSDNLIQLSAFRSGVLRLSATELRTEIETAGNEINTFLKDLGNREKVKQQEEKKEQWNRLFSKLQLSSGSDLD